MKKKLTGRRKTKKTDKKVSIRSKVHIFKREKILEMASQLFFERGYKSTSLDAIAKELGVTKPFIYYQFNSKQEILHELIQRTLKKTNSIFDGLDLENGNPTELMKELMFRFTKGVINTRMETAMFWREHRELSEEDIVLTHKDKQKFDLKFTNILERGVENGEFTLKDPKLTTLLLQGMVIWIYTWYREEHRLKPDEIATEASNLVLKMISKKGGN